jgi:ubiquinone/menaquinone biosynthesis C-methylase UbiE
VLGSTDAEQERLIRQAAILDPFTERLFRDAGIGPGQRVLDIGSGMGDVAMLASRLVGRSGEVVGVERDASMIAKARARVAAGGLGNVTFIEADISSVATAEPFDAVVGRFILQFLPDPAEVLRSLSLVARPGGVLAFQEPTWGPFLQIIAHMPLTSACASLIQQTLHCSGARTAMELVLYRAFLDAGFPVPSMRIELPIGGNPDFTRWVYDLFCTVRPRLAHYDLSCEALGDLDTLLPRLQAEVNAAKSFDACLGLVGAWSGLSS